MFIYFLFLLYANDKIVEVRYTDSPPVIDGYIEEVWNVSDSASDFIQVLPYNKKSPSDRTIVYTLQDDNNLYVAFRAYTDNYKCISCLGGIEDMVTLFINPFEGNNTAYYFNVNLSGQVTVQDDGLILDDGRRRDITWDGVWYSGCKIYDGFYSVEVKIPFKSIRFKKNKSEWGINFERYITKNNETDSWVELEVENTDMVSAYGRLKGIKPKSTGYHFEFFPEIYLRYDKVDDEEGEYKPFGSINFKWDVTSEASINATVNPDFAQIEADPFTLNLSRYPVYLDERRSFFLEGIEIFRFSNFQEGSGFYSPINIFYSRRIGKSINGNPIPITGGLKITSRSRDWNIGALGAYTDEFTDGDSILEAGRGFGVLRAKRRIGEDMETGVLLSGTYADKDNYNYSLGIDGAYLSGLKQFIFQGAYSRKNQKDGFGFSSGYYGFTERFMSIVVAEAISDSFDVSDIGFTPWSGRKRILFITGPYWNFRKGFIRRISFAPILSIRKRPGSNRWSKIGGLFINTNFRNRWGFYFELVAGPYYEPDVDFFFRSLNLDIWGGSDKFNTNFGFYYSYSYNYRRNFVSYQGNNWFSLNYTPVERISLVMDGNLWIEWDTLNNIIACTPGITPRINLTLTKNLSLSIFNESVFELPEAEPGEGELLSNRTGFLLSWNFRPKSWMYLALNDYRTRNDTGDFNLENRIAALKVKYLFNF